MVEEGTIPESNYLLNTDFGLNTHPGSKHLKHVDMLRNSIPHKPWNSNFDRIFISSGDVFMDNEHLSNLINTSKKENCSVFTFSKFPKYHARLSRHYHLKCNNKSNLVSIHKSSIPPTHALWHPYIFTKGVFAKYFTLPINTSKPDFVKQLLDGGTKIKVCKPKIYFNINYPQDIEKLNKLLR
jgi:NDP-sugar pyrophosphorylase family protein